MKTYTGTIQVVGFVPVEVEANSKEEAESLLEASADSYATGEVTSIMFSGHERLEEDE